MSEWLSHLVVTGEGCGLRGSQEMEPVSVSAAREGDRLSGPCAWPAITSAKTELCSGRWSGRTRGDPGGALPRLLYHMGPRHLTEQAKGGRGTDELLHMVEGDLGL